MRRVPTVLQVEALECGAACLAMILAHHGRWIPLVELRRLCGVSRDGSRAGSMVSVARDLGMTADGYRLGPAKLEEARLPAIAFVDGNHFVVLEGFGRGVVYVNDPAGGRITYHRDEFEALYSGVILAMQPTASFVRGGRAPGVLAPLLARLAGARLTALLVMASGIALILPSLVVPSFTRIFVDRYLLDDQADLVPWLVAAIAAVTALQFGLMRIQHWSQHKLRARVAVVAAAGFMQRVLRLPVGFFAQRSAASISARLNMAERLADHAAMQLTSLLPAAVATVLLGLLMLAYSPVLTGCSAAVALTTCVVVVFANRRLAEADRRLARDQIKLSSRTMQGLTLLETVKASATEERFLQRWTGQQALVVSQQQSMARLAGVSTALTDSLTTFGNTVAITVGGLLVMRGELTLGLLLAFLVLQGLFFLPVRALLDTGAAVARARATLDQFEDVEDSALASEFDAPAAAPERQRAGRLGQVRKLEGRIELQGVTFGYARLAPPLIEDLSLSIEPGSSVALVGASGSGKSTIGRLVTGLYEPWAGRVLIDGKPIGQVPRALLRNSMAVVDQEIAMFAGTVRDNITLWDETIPEERVVHAAQDANIHDEILRRENGYDGRVEEDGGNFSGGQRQRAGDRPRLGNRSGCDGVGRGDQRAGCTDGRSASPTICGGGAARA